MSVELFKAIDRARKEGGEVVVSAAVESVFPEAAWQEGVGKVIEAALSAHGILPGGHRIGGVFSGLARECDSMDHVERCTELYKFTLYDGSGREVVRLGSAFVHFMRGSGVWYVYGVTVSLPVPVVEMLLRRSGVSAF